MALTGTTEAKDWLGQPGWLTAAKAGSRVSDSKGPQRAGRIL